MARWALISGEKGHNKSALALELVERLKAEGVRAAGFVQLRHYDESGEKGYQLLRLATGERLVLARGGVAPRDASQEAFCSYAFDNDAFARAHRWLQEDLPAAPLVVLDDISKLEVQGKGHAAALASALAQPDKVVLVCARASQLFYVVENFGLGDEPVDALELPADEEAQARFVARLAEACQSLARLAS